MVDPRMAHASCARAAAASPRHALGLSFLYVILIMAIIMVFVSFAVDVGRMRIARAQLQTAADASARAGANALPRMTSKIKATDVLDRAEAMAEQNKSLGETINCDRLDDIDLGQWDKVTRTFTELPDDRVLESNAVRTTTKRLTSRSNAVPLIFAPMTAAIDAKVKPTVNEIETPAIAYVAGGPTRNFAVVGLDYINVKGNGVTIASYSPPSTVDKQGASIASNGDINAGNGNVLGDARPGVDGELDSGPNAQISGWQAPLDEPLLTTKDGIYKAVQDPPSPYTEITMPQGSDKTPSGNGWSWTDTGQLNLTGGSTELTAKNFYVNADFTAKVVSITGYVKLYVRGDFTMAGNNITLTDGDSDPRRFKVYVLAGAYDVTIGGTPNQYMILNAPGADVTVVGTSQFWGSIVGKSVTMTGTINIHYPDYLATDKTPFRISLVK
jgi:Flp pilus assembly protein TadG